MNRWARLVAAVVAMIMIANLQYAWTLFVKPLIAANHWKLSDVQWGFTFFIAFETWMMPLSGWMIDRLGPRIFMSVAGVMCGVGWSALAYVHSLPALYVFYSLAGFGAALVYCCSIAVSLKWFPDRRGLASGLIAAGFGSGAALFIPGIAYIIRTQNYQSAFIYTGIFQGLMILLAGQFARNPDPSLQAATRARPAPRVQVRTHGEEFNSIQMLRTPHFYVMYLTMLMMGVGGLMVTAQVAVVADTLKVGAAAVTLALSLNPIANGAGRLVWGWVSDRIGRENTMVVAFLLQALFLTSVLIVGRWSPTWFIIALALVYFTWGEVYSLFPSLSGDLFGSRHASSNYAFLYSTKGVASIVGGGLAARLYEATGTWSTAFYGSALLALCAAAMAVALKKMALPVKSRQAEHLTTAAG
jgi:OFA family oxalate/formate antiporter-like MFS transporter